MKVVLISMPDVAPLIIHEAAIHMPGLVTNAHNYKRYSGLWANVRTRHLDADQLQFLFWYHRQKVLGWWEPSARVRRDGRGWTGIWTYAFKPMLKIILGRIQRKQGWQGRYRREIERLERMNTFPDLEQIKP